MKESVFIEKNKKKWHEFEKQSNAKDTDPDKLSQLFVQMTEDLSHARTFYPKRSVRVYLNYLAQKAFDSLNLKKTKRARKLPQLTGELQIITGILFLFGFFLGFLAGFEKSVGTKLIIGLFAGSLFTLPVLISRLRDFFFYSLPIEMYRSRKQLVVAFVIFGLSVLIGIISSIIDPEFARIVLGDYYVDMTLDYIDQDDPMAVYKQEGEFGMFLGITINNLRVDFLAFVLGVFFSIGSALVLMFNGIMVGAFQYFFKTKGLLLTTFLIIWIHGTLEMSAAVISGCAGMVMGNGLLFPKTYSRVQSFQISARRGAKILLGILPLTFVAGFLEGFVTRHTEMPDAVKWAIILSSFAFVVFYFVIYPHLLVKKIGKGQIKEEKPAYQKPAPIKKYRIRDLGAVFYDSFGFFREKFGTFGSVVLKIILPVQLAFLIIYFTFFSTYGGYLLTESQNLSLALSLDDEFTWLGFVFNTLLFSLNIATVNLCVRHVETIKKKNFFSFWLKYVWVVWLKTLPLVALVLITLAKVPWGYHIVLIFLLPFFILIFPSVSTEKFGEGISKGMSMGAKSWALLLVICILQLFFFWAFYYGPTQVLMPFIDQVITWHTVNVVENDLLVNNIVQAFIKTGYIHVLLTIFFSSFAFFYYGMVDKEEAKTLNERFKSFGKRSKIYETPDIN